METKKKTRPLKVERTATRDEITIRSRSRQRCFVAGSPAELFIVGDLDNTELRRLLPHLQAWCETGSLRTTED